MPEVETIGAGAEVGAGAIMTMVRPAKEIAAAADFLMEGLGVAGLQDLLMSLTLYSSWWDQR